VNYGVGFKPKATCSRPATKLRARLLQVGLHRMVDDSPALAAKIATDYGLKGAPAYAFAATQGTVGAPDYPQPLAAGKDGCFLGKLTGVAGLAGNLGVAVSGLNDRWTAFCQSVGADPRTDARTRLIAAEAGTGYAVLRAEDEGRTLFLGHPLLADKPEVVLNVTRSRDWKTWLAEIHNPTDAALTVTVRTNPHLTGLTFSETLTLPPAPRSAAPSAPPPRGELDRESGSRGGLGEWAGRLNGALQSFGAKVSGVVLFPYARTRQDGDLADRRYLTRHPHDGHRRMVDQTVERGESFRHFGGRPTATR